MSTNKRWLQQVSRVIIAPLWRAGLAVLMAVAFMPAHAEDEYLVPEKAFGFSATVVDAKTVDVTYAIADGYYMYRERFQFAAVGATLGKPSFPDGKIKFDETFKKNVETYRHSVTIRVPVAADGKYTLRVMAQGCADQGLCYAPMESVADLSVHGSGITGLLKSLGASSSQVNTSSAPVLARAATEAAAPALGPAPEVPLSATGSDGESSRIETALQSGRLLVIVPLFLLLGLGLAFTPCVLPMVPILSSIIVGEGSNVSRRRGFMLALTYSLGMALVYTALGVAAGLVGEGLAATLQNPWILSSFSLLMVGLSLSMFGWYELQVPAVLQARLTTVSQNQRGGKTAGVFIMGALSALIVGPCVAAPLAGALVYISQSRDVVVGGSALFALAIGMSVPLLLVGLSAGTLLPRAGIWMDAVKRFFGVLMLGVALWMVSPLLSAVVQMAFWAMLGIGYGAYLLWSGTQGWALKAVGLVFAALGLLQLVGLATGGRDTLQPLAHLGSGAPQKHLEFKRIKSSADLDATLASAGGKTVMLDFYADWCVSCKEMEKLTFTDSGIQQQLANTILLQADVTANNADDRALLKRFGLFGPPGIILFDKDGKEISAGRIIGYQNSERFSRSLGVLAPS